MEKIDMKQLVLIIKIVLCYTSINGYSMGIPHSGYYENGKYV